MRTQSMWPSDNQKAGSSGSADNAENYEDLHQDDNVVHYSDHHDDDNHHDDIHDHDHLANSAKIKYARIWVQPRLIASGN